MATQLQLRRGSTVDIGGFTGAEGEIVYDVQEHRLVAHDGTTPGGFPQALKGESPFEWMTSDDNLLCYFGNVKGASVSFQKGVSGSTPDLIEVTLPAECTVTSMVIYQKQEYIGNTQCKVVFDKTGVQFDNTAANESSIATLCKPNPYAFVFQVTSTGLQDNRSGVTQVNTHGNALVLSGLWNNDDRVFKLVF